MSKFQEIYEDIAKRITYDDINDIIDASVPYGGGKMEYATYGKAWRSAENLIKYVLRFVSPVKKKAYFKAIKKIADKYKVDLNKLQ